jgi:hypothetical protein
VIDHIKSSLSISLYATGKSNTIEIANLGLVRNGTSQITWRKQ